MNGNIQVEPTRVKLDKQGATTFLTKVTTVDAIVRPHSLGPLYIVINEVLLFLSNKKVFEKNLGMREWAPTFSVSSSPTPSLDSGQNKWWGMLNENRSQLGYRKWESFAFRAAWKGLKERGRGWGHPTIRPLAYKSYLPAGDTQGPSPPAILEYTL